MNTPVQTVPDAPAPSVPAVPSARPRFVDAHPLVDKATSLWVLIPEECPLGFIVRGACAAYQGCFGGKKLKNGKARTTSRCEFAIPESLVAINDTKRDFTLLCRKAAAHLPVR